MRYRVLSLVADMSSQSTSRRVLVASKNPVKLGAVECALRRCFPEVTFQCKGMEVDSGVSAQPFGDEETLLGARNRVAAAACNNSAMVVAIEGGVGWTADKSLECFAWVVARSPTTGAESKARSASFVLPKEVARLVEGGMELGAADDQVFSRVKSGSGTGTIGKLTGGLITRQSYYEHAVMMALVPFMNPDLYPEHQFGAPSQANQ